MQFRPFEEGIEVSGESLGALVDGFRKYPSLAAKYLSMFGLVKCEPGEPLVLDRNAWYPLKEWLLAYEGIARELGYNSLYAIGRAIPENGLFPQYIRSIKEALVAIDVVYHLNHRKNGKVMFDLETGEKLDGIGYYRSEFFPDENRIVCVCKNPYPCDFDHGLIAGLAGCFEPGAKTAHDKDAPCRKRGSDDCTYIISW